MSVGTTVERYAVSSAKDLVASGCPFHTASGPVAKMLERGLQIEPKLQHGLGLYGENAVRDLGGVRKRESYKAFERFDMRSEPAHSVAVRDALQDIFAPIAAEIHEGVDELAHTDPSRMDRLARTIRVTSFSPLGHERAMLEVTQRYGPTMRRLRPIPDSLRIDVTELMQADTRFDIGIGDYGMPLATALLDAASAMQRVAKVHIEPHVREIADQSGHLLHDWTFQETALRSAIEGVSTIASTTSTLTTRRMGSRDARATLQLLRDGIAFEQAATAPFGFWGAMSTGHFAPIRPLKIGAAGQARLSKATLGLMRDAREQWFASNWEYIKTMSGEGTGIGCPILPSALIATGDGVVENRWLRVLARDYIDLAIRYLDDPIEATAKEIESAR